jgi:hypothetical protein
MASDILMKIWPVDFPDGSDTTEMTLVYDYGTAPFPKRYRGARLGEVVLFLRWRRPSHRELPVLARPAGHSQAILRRGGIKNSFTMVV